MQILSDACLRPCSAAEAKTEPFLGWDNITDPLACCTACLGLYSILLLPLERCVPCLPLGARPPMWQQFHLKALRHALVSNTKHQTVSVCDCPAAALPPCLVPSSSVCSACSRHLATPFLSDAEERCCLQAAHTEAQVSWEPPIHVGQMIG